MTDGHLAAEFATALQPSRAEIATAKETILALATTGTTRRSEDLIQAAILGAGDDPLVYSGEQESLDLSDGKIDPSHRVVRRERGRIIATHAIAELVADGILTPSPTPGDDEVRIGWRTPGMGSSTAIPSGAPKLAPAYILMHRLRDRDQPAFLEESAYTDGIEDLLGERGLRCISEALAAHRRGLHLAAVNMLGAASEAAWYAIGERLRDGSPALAVSLDEGRTAQVLRLVADNLEKVKYDNGRPARTDVGELRVTAIHLRDLRNYGLHPRDDISTSHEPAFTEAGAALLTLQANRYFHRLREVAQAAGLFESAVVSEKES